MSDEKDEARVAAGCLLMLVWWPFAVVWWAWVTMVVWNQWMPVAFALPALTFRTAIAFNVVKSMTLFGYDQEPANDKDALEIVTAAISKVLSGGLLILATSWLTHALTY